MGVFDPAAVLLAAAALLGYLNHRLLGLPSTIGILVLSLAVRAARIVIPALPLHLHAQRKTPAIALLTWAGLCGGISIALVLSLPAGAGRDHLLTACCAVVLFTMIVQGLTVHPLAARRFPPEAPGREQEPRRADEYLPGAHP